MPHAAVTSAEDQPRTAFITGSGRKLGRAFALEFARRGCRLVLHALNDRKTCEATAEEVRQLSGKEVLVVMGDIGNSKDMKNIAARALEAFGVVDIVINNVGYRVHQPFLEMPEETWQRIFDVNLNGPYYACRAFAPGMVEQGWGRIVNLLGVNAIKGEEMRVALSASKQGLLGMTKALGKELGPHGVTVNAINPGYLDHELDTPEERDRIDKAVRNDPGTTGWRTLGNCGAGGIPVLECRGIYQRPDDFREWRDRRLSPPAGRVELSPKVNRPDERLAADATRHLPGRSALLARRMFAAATILPLPPLDASRRAEPFLDVATAA